MSFIRIAAIAGAGLFVGLASAASAAPINPAPLQTIGPDAAVEQVYYRNGAAVPEAIIGGIVSGVIGSAVGGSCYYNDCGYGDDGYYGGGGYVGGGGRGYRGGGGRVGGGRIGGGHVGGGHAGGGAHVATGGHGRR
jgi:hypothetical protein